MSDLHASKDPLGTAIDKSVEEAAKIAKEYLDKLIGPGLEESGGIIADTVAYWRFKNKVKLVLKAKAFLQAKAIDPKRVLPKVIAPLLEAGSLEGENDMKDRWASLLASAATEPKSVPPAFPKILSELSSAEANILDWLTDRVHKQDGWFATGEEIRNIHKIATWEYEVLMGNLVRLNLCRPAQELEYTINYTDSTTTRITEWQSYQQIELTRLGYRFVQACRVQE